MSKKKPATDKDVEEFLEAVYPGNVALAKASFDEGHTLRMATEIIKSQAAQLLDISQDREMGKVRLAEAEGLLARIGTGILYDISCEAFLSGSFNLNHLGTEADKIAVEIKDFITHAQSANVAVKRSDVHKDINKYYIDEDALEGKAKSK